MPIMFNTILREAGLPLGDVCLLRHQDNRAERGRTPYELWRDDRPAFYLYQSHQRVEARRKFSRRYWASFVVTSTDETLFVGIYAATHRGLLDQDTPQPHRNGFDEAGSCDVYDLSTETVLSDLIGRLYVEWGAGFRAWVQRADKQNKLIKELRTEFKEPDFPGFMNFVLPLSKLAKLPTAWVFEFNSFKGIYLLTC